MEEQERKRLALRNAKEEVEAFKESVLFSQLRDRGSREGRACLVPLDSVVSRPWANS